eukprot:scaffold117770_cov48-Phaeocystis_antarctica.AAC.2
MVVLSVPAGPGPAGACCLNGPPMPACATSALSLSAPTPPPLSPPSPRPARREPLSRSANIHRGRGGRPPSGRAWAPG